MLSNDAVVPPGRGTAEEHHDPVTGELGERALRLAHQWPQRAAIFAQKFENFLRLCQDNWVAGWRDRG